MIVGRAVGSLDVITIHQNSHGHPLDPSTLNHLGADSFGYFVIDCFFVLLRGFTGVVVGALRISTRQLVVDSDLAFFRIVGKVVLGPCLRGANHAAFGIKTFLCLLNTVKIHLSRNLHAGATTAHNRGHDVFNLCAHTALVALLLFNNRPGDIIGIACTIGQQTARFVDD